jgi:hypothetical protein
VVSLSNFRCHAGHCAGKKSVAALTSPRSRGEVGALLRAG